MAGGWWQALVNTMLEPWPAKTSIPTFVRLAGRRHLRKRAAVSNAKVPVPSPLRPASRLARAEQSWKEYIPTVFTVPGDFDGCERAAVLERIFPMLGNPSGSVAAAKAVQPSNVLFPYTVTEAGISMDVSALQFRNAATPMLCSPSSSVTPKAGCAAVERTCPYACYRRRDPDGRKAGVVSERVAATLSSPSGSVPKAGAPADVFLPLCLLPKTDSMAVRLVQLAERVAAIMLFQPVGQRDVLKAGAASNASSPMLLLPKTGYRWPKAAAAVERFVANAFQPVGAA